MIEFEKPYNMITESPQDQGLYRKESEHDSCGIGFVAQLKGKKIPFNCPPGLDILKNMTHRGAEGADSKTGDGAGVLLTGPA